jgi:hypothetical protein
LYGKLEARPSVWVSPCRKIDKTRKLSAGLVQRVANPKKSDSRAIAGNYADDIAENRRFVF